MPPRILLSPARLAYRTKSIIPLKRATPNVTQRHASDKSKDMPVKETPGKGPNQAQLPHVSEEQAAIDKSMGNTPPDISQGTPVQEVLERDGGKDKAPEVMKKGFDTSSTTQSRSYSTSARRHAMDMETASSPPDTIPISLEYPDAGFGHKYPLPDVGAMPRTEHFRRRYDTVVDQVTKSLMRHGKLSQAQTNMDIILNTLRTTPVPQPNLQFPNRTLLGTLPREALPLSPIEYLTTAIDSVAPLVKIRQQRGVMGGGASLPIPVPLGIRQRRRTAIQWILNSADSRKEVRLADRVAREIINVAEGKGGAWERRQMVHRLAISARSNVRMSLMGPRGGGRRKKLAGK